MTLVHHVTGEIVTHGIEAWNGRNHPAADRYPMMSDDEILELAEDIATNGLLENLTLDDEGNLVDGRNRMKACSLTGVEIRFEVYVGSDVAGFVVSKNEHRRHLSDQARIALRRDRVAELAAQGMSTRAIAAEVDVDQATVVRDIEVMHGASPLFEGGEPDDAPARVKGADGKTYPTTHRGAWTPEDAAVFLDRYHNLTGVEDRGLLAADYGLSVKSLPNTARTCRKALAIVAPKLTKPQKVDRIRELATSGATAKQIGGEVDLTEKVVRKYAADAGVVLVADKVIGSVKRLDANRVVGSIVDRVRFDIDEDSVLAAVRLADVDHDLIAGWVSSLSDSIRSLTTLKNRLKKELTQ